MNVLYFCIYTCSAQLSICHMEWHSKYTITTITTIVIYEQRCQHTLLRCVQDQAKQQADEKRKQRCTQRKKQRDLLTLMRRRRKQNKSAHQPQN